jgi:hypothetical protein
MTARLRADDGHSLGRGPVWLLSQLGQVAWVASQQHHRARLIERNGSEQGVQRVPMPGRAAVS